MYNANILYHHKNQRRNLYTLHRFRHFSAVSTVYVDFHALKKGPDGWKIMAKVFTEA